jgi:hypothetical protein
MWRVLNRANTCIHHWSCPMQFTIKKMHTYVHQLFWDSEWFDGVINTKQQSQHYYHSLVHFSLIWNWVSKLSSRPLAFAS